MAGNIQMGKVRNDKLEPVTDIDVRIDLAKGFLLIPYEVLCDDFGFVEYNKIIKMESILPGHKGWYDENNITQERIDEILALISDVGAVSGNVYAFKVSEDADRDYRVYAYVYDVDSSNISASIYTIDSKTVITSGYTIYDLKKVNDPEFSYFKFNADIEDICNEDNWEKLTTNIAVVDKDKCYSVSYYLWSFVTGDGGSGELGDLVYCQIMITESLYGTGIEMIFLSDGRYVIQIDD